MPSRQRRCRYSRIKLLRRVQMRESEEQANQQVMVNPDLVINAYERKLSEANKEIVMLEALVNQQNQMLIEQVGQIAALSTALEEAKGEPDSVPEPEAVDPPSQNGALP